MAKTVTTSRVLARGSWSGRGWVRFICGGALALAASYSTAQAAPTVDQMLKYAPKHEVAISTPTGADLESHKVELVKGGSGWALKDAQGRLVRKFLASDGKAVDTYSYYKDGAEVYREIVSPGATKPDHFRWLNAGGSKYGVDDDKNGTIDTWRAISAEEVSQEVLKALATRDAGRLEALLISDDDIRALGLPAELADAFKARRKGVKEKFDATLAKLTKLTAKAAWMHLETGAPQCVPADEIGTKADLVRYARATVLFEAGGANEWFQIGQMIKVGNTWKIIDAPTPGSAVEEPVGGAGAGAARTTMDIGADPKLQALVQELSDLDKKTTPTEPKAAAEHHVLRANVLEKIVAAVKPNERDPWIRQVADSLSSAVQAAGTSDGVAGKRLASLVSQLETAMPGHNLSAYVVFRSMQADYSNRLSDPKAKFAEVQKDWLDRLGAFVKAYPKAEDAADAMLQLGMVSEFLGKETEARGYYAALAKAFPGKPQALKAAGAARRIGLEGEAMPLAGPNLTDTNAVVDIGDFKGKVVVVYYWASWNNNAAGDFAKLKAIAADSNKQVEILSVNLDNTAEEARSFLAKNPAPGTHIYQSKGLDGKLATDYGVMVLPSLFVVGKDGKVVSKGAQISTLDEEVKKVLKSAK